MTSLEQNRLQNFKNKGKDQDVSYPKKRALNKSYFLFFICNIPLGILSSLIVVFSVNPEHKLRNRVGLVK